MHQLIMTVLPLQPDLSPFLMQIMMEPEKDRNLKSVFEHEIYWRKVFEGQSPIYPP